MKKNILIVLVSLIVLNLNAQLKIGANPKSINNNTNFHVESSDGNNFVISRDSTKVGVGTLTPSNVLHVKSDGNPIRLEGLLKGDSTESILTVNDSGVVRKVNGQTLSAAYEPWYNVSTNLGAMSNTQNIYQMGRVGVMTNSPTFPLEVMGTNVLDGFAIGNTSLGSSFRTKISAQGSGSNDRWMKFNSDWNSTTNGTRAFGFFRGANEYLTILDNGNVGIGVNNPTWYFDVRKNTANSELMAHFVNVSQSTTAESQIGIGGGPGVWTKIVGYDGTLGIRNYSTNKEFVTFKPHTGSVGIGIVSPISRLHVVKDSFETDGFDDYLFDSYGNTTQGMELRKFSGKLGAPLNISSGTLIGYYGFSPRANNNNLYGTTGMFGYYMGDGINTNTELRFRTSYLDRMTINSQGFVGIGTTNPLYPVHMKTGANTNLFLENTSGDPDGVLAISIPNYNINCGGSITCSNMISFQNGGTWIGTIVPTSNGLGTQYLTTSDARLKENVLPTSFSINDLMKINVVDYNYKLDVKKNKEVGFIAQEMYNILPSLVRVGEDEMNKEGLPKKPWMVDYSRLTPHIIKATQDLKIMLDEKEAILKEIKQKLIEKDLEIIELKNMILQIRNDIQNINLRK